MTDEHFRRFVAHILPDMIAVVIAGILLAFAKLMGWL